jgi:glutamate synthase (ferredoxin)
MIAVGCIAARICHTNNCPVGVTTQKEKLREKFVGAPFDMYNFFYFAATEVRQAMADMGYASMSDITGRADLLQPNGKSLHKTENLDLAFVAQMPPALTEAERAWEPEQPEPHAQMYTLDDELLARDDVAAAIEGHEDRLVEAEIFNTDRAATARIAGAIAARHGNRGWKGSLHLRFTGCAGQSFGAFCLDGLDLEVRGDANDYVGKSLHGGRIRILPGKDPAFTPSECSIVGNTCLYGATGGKFFGYGRAGERFCVRNSNAQAVIEGTGDHCCEYMTGGCVVVLGPVGRNVGAGQTGGWGYFLDAAEGDEAFLKGYELPARINNDVNIQRLNPIGAAQLRDLVEQHLEATGSAKAKAILDDWEAYLQRFWHVYPSSEKGAPEVSGVTAEETARLADEKAKAEVAEKEKAEALA